MALRVALSAALLAACLPSSGAFAFSPSAVRPGGSRASAAVSRAAPLRMAASEEGKKKKLKLGPGLFSPDIQVGPEANWKGLEGVPLLKRDAVEKLFDGIDADSNGKIDKEELMELALALGQKWDDKTTRRVLAELDDDSNGLVPKETFLDWYLAGKMNEVSVSEESEDDEKKMEKMSRAQCESFFQMVDTNGDSRMDVGEFKNFVDQLGLDWDDGKCDKVFKRLDSDQSGLLTFQQFYAWYSSTADLDFGPTLKEATMLQFQLNKGADDARKIFVRGFPPRAGPDVAEKYFGRAGEIEEIKCINLRNNSSTGRMIVTYKTEDCVGYALEMHRFKMGNRSVLEVYRVNRGDLEEVHEVPRSMHGALIGIRGSNVQRMQKESGAKIFFEAEPKEIMIIKGTGKERSKAWSMAQAIMQQNQCDSHKVHADLHGRLIGAKGNVKIAMESESGAHIVYRKTPIGICLVYGTQEARERAWQLIQEKMWEIEHDSETKYNLDQKYHGMLTGKGGIAVKALQEEANVRIRFVGTHKNKGGSGAGDTAPESTGDGDNAEKGLMIVRGTPENTQRAWKISQILIRELPALLSDLREEDIGLGSLISLPLSPAQMWSTAIESAMKTALKEVGAQSAEDRRGEIKKGVEGNKEPDQILML